MNTIVVVGNLTRNPEAGTLPGQDVPTSRFGIAENFKVKGEDVAQFYRVNAIGAQAKFANDYLTSGRQVFVQGDLQLQQFTKNDGTPGVSLEIRAQKVQALGPKPEASETSQSAAGTASGAAEDDGPPF